ncbi:MAG: inorganic diphosphatase [Pseudomonadota bacterium]
MVAVKAVIEISKGSNLKLEYNDKNELELDRIAVKSFPFNYGYIQKTLASDGDPSDIIILSSQALPHGVVTKFEVLGVLIMEDEAGQDNKIIAKLPEKIDPELAEIKDLNDISSYLKSKIKFFFETYKTLEPNKWVKVNKFENKEFAEKLITKSILDYNTKIN